jgi:hypothetical protein
MRKSIVLALTIALATPALLFAEDIPQLKTAADAATKAASAAPADYAANWKAAEACRKYGDEMVVQESADWKNLAKATAREGMKYGDLATKLNPTGVEGWYWYGCCVGTYSDCVSILTAISEGLKGKTQKAFESAYSLNSSYEKGGPILSLGRFWQVLPGIAGRDLKKAEKLYNEYMGKYSSEVTKDAWYFRGALYKDTGRKEEARADLQKAAAMGQKDAQKLLAELK